jgi:hypothetical protein
MTYTVFSINGSIISTNGSSREKNKNLNFIHAMNSVATNGVWCGN